MSDYSSVVIVGASLAGVRTARQLRRKGFEGQVTLLGAERHPPYERPPLSKQVLTGKAAPADTALLSPGDGADFEVRLGVKATGVDPGNRRVTLEDGAAIGYDALVVATGAESRELPPAVTGNLEDVVALRSLDDALAVRAALATRPRVAVVGAGFIGCEVAASARALGCEVELIEAAPVPLARVLGPVAGAEVAELHRAHGVRVRLGCSVDRFLGDRRVEAVQLAGGEVVDADLVVVGVGARPATDWLSDSGIRVEDGVVCSADGAASAPGVYAAGDVARWFSPRYGRHLRLEHWTSAHEQADIVAGRIAGAADTRPIGLPYCWSDQYDRRLQFAGMPGAQETVLHRSADSREFLVGYGDNGKFVGAFAVNAPRMLLQARQFIDREVPVADAAERFAAAA